MKSLAVRTSSSPNQRQKLKNRKLPVCAFSPLPQVVVWRCSRARKVRFGHLLLRCCFARCLESQALKDEVLQPVAPRLRSLRAAGALLVVHLSRVFIEDEVIRAPLYETWKDLWRALNKRCKKFDFQKREKKARERKKFKKKKSSPRVSLSHRQCVCVSLSHV